MTGQTFAIIGSLFGAFVIQTFWIYRALDKLDRGLDKLETAIKDTRTELSGQISETRDILLRDHGERIAKLEAADR